jgi:uncharacterized protein (DUF1330 family)
MAAHYLFDNLEISDPDALAAYAKEAAKIVAEHGGPHVAVDVIPEIVEGDAGLRQGVLMEFPDGRRRTSRRRTGCRRC